MAKTKQKWDPRMGITKAEFEKHRRAEESGSNKPLNPKLADAPPTGARKKQSARVKALLNELAKTSGPAADAMATKDNLTAEMVKFKIAQARRKKKPRR